MRCKQAVSLILMIGCLVFSPLPAVQALGQQEEIRIPKDLKFTLELLSPISTAKNQKGDTFSCKVLKPDAYAGATISGNIKKLKRSGKAKGKSEIELAFDDITLSDGRTGGFNAQVTEVYDVVDAGDGGKADTEGAVKGKSTVKRDIGKAVAGAAIGAIIGGLLGGAKGAAIGAAIGAGAMVSTSLSTRGPDLEFKEGTQFVVLTNAPSRRRKSSPPALQQNSAPATTGDTTPTIENAPPPSVAVQPTVLQPARLITPPAPSTRFRSYTGNKLVRLSVPVNWRESSNNNPVVFAPDGGYIFYRDNFVLTHGVMVGVTVTGEVGLKQATDKYLGALLEANPYLRPQAEARLLNIASHNGLAVDLNGESPITGQTEMVTFYATLLEAGKMFYLIAVVQKNEHKNYEKTFESIISSIRLNN